MSVYQQDVQETYRDLLDAIVESRWVVAAEDKDVIDGYWEMVFRITEHMVQDLTGTPSRQIFQEHVRSAILALRQMERDLAGGVIHSSDIASSLAEKIQRALDISGRFLNPPPTL